MRRVFHSCCANRHLYLRISDRCIAAWETVDGCMRSVGCHEGILILYGCETCDITGETVVLSVTTMPHERSLLRRSHSRSTNQRTSCRHGRGSMRRSEHSLTSCNRKKESCGHQAALHLLVFSTCHWSTTDLKKWTTQVCTGKRRHACPTHLSKHALIS